MHAITVSMCLICVFYTSIGGIKAVVWTDTLQFAVMVGASVAVVVIGTNAGGGFATVLKRADEGARLNLFE